jgi:hypothetical protein
MATIPQAVESAKKFLADVYGEKVLPFTRLEEVELGQRDGKATWEITLSFLITEDPSSSVTATALHALALQPKRTYKSFTISKDTGDVLSMKIRELAGA